MSDAVIQQELTKVRRMIPLGSIWRHRRGGEYYVVGHCLLAGHLVPAVLCRGDDAIIWCRPMDQFFDGRLICIDQGVSPGVTQRTSSSHAVA